MSRLIQTPEVWEKLQTSGRGEVGGLEPLEPLVRRSTEAESFLLDK